MIKSVSEVFYKSNTMYDSNNSNYNKSKEVETKENNNSFKEVFEAVKKSI